MKRKETQTLQIGVERMLRDALDVFRGEPEQTRQRRSDRRGSARMIWLEKLLVTFADLFHTLE